MMAVAAAVMCFFTMAIIGAIKGVSPATCGYRAVIGALIAYVVTSLAARAVLAVIIDAIVSSKFNMKQREDDRGGTS